MKKLSKVQIKERDEVSSKLSQLREEFDDAVCKWSDVANTANDAEEKAWGGVKTAQADYNVALDEARGFRDRVVESIGDYMDARSEKWLESDKGQEYEDWKSQWEDVDLEDVDLQKEKDADGKWEKLSLDDVEDHAQLIEDLPEEVGG